MSDLHKIRILQYFAEDKSAVECDSLELTEGKGICGDRHYGSGDKQVTISAYETIRKISEDPKGGLCFRRYRCNIAVDEFRSDKLEIGSEIKAGNVVLRITGFKECFPDSCELSKSGGNCPIRSASVYASVIKSGTVKIGDEVEIWK